MADSAPGLRYTHNAVKAFFVILTLLWSVLTLFGLWFVLPDRDADVALIVAVWDLGDANLEEAYRDWYASNAVGESPTFARLAAVSADDSERQRHIEMFREFYNETQPTSLDDVPRLVWATDDNPARRLQMQLFRRWHLENYGELIDIVTDPASRDTREGASVTKPVVQSIGGAGADILETYGPKQLEAMVRSGIALDVSSDAQSRGFGFERCFDAARSSFVYDGRQYGFPANVGYTVLFYHKDMFEDAGIEMPTGGWSIDQLVEISHALTVESDDIPGGKRFGIVGMHPWPMSLSAGAMFFSDDGSRSTYNSQNTVVAYQHYLDLMYTHKVMPTPADSASMAAAGGFTGGGNNELFFAARLCAMTTGGRWSYPTFAQRNFNSVIRPRLEAIAAVSSNRDLIHRIENIIESLDKDVLIPLASDDYRLIRDSLTDEDRANLMRVGVAHVPTVNGDIKYTDVGARVALVNAASPRREYALRFLEFLGSEAYNERINQAFDSICGVIEYCVDDDGISGPPEPLPGLEDFDSHVFVEAMDGAESQQLSDFIGPERVGDLAGRVMDQLTNNRFSAAEAAKLIEDRLNAQIKANIIRESHLQALWESLHGHPFDPDAFDGGTDR